MQHLHSLTHKQKGEGGPSARALAALVFSNVRFRNAQSLHNSSGSGVGKSGGGEGGGAARLRQYPGLSLTGNHWGKSSFSQTDAHTCDPRQPQHNSPLCPLHLGLFFFFFLLGIVWTASSQRGWQCGGRCRWWKTLLFLPLKGSTSHLFKNA